MKTVRIHYLQHVPFEGLGYIEDWALQNGHTLTATKFYEHYTIPDIKNVDWLIIMGGPMGVYDEAEYSWLKNEKKLIREAIESGKVVIGICLGSQLIAEVLGAKVFANNEKEIGWFDVSLTKQGEQHPLFEGFNITFPVFHWHGDTFKLPNNAIHLIESKGCKNQAFIYGERILGLQFHLEVTPLAMKEMVKQGKDELQSGRFTQNEQEILNSLNKTMQTNHLLKQILDRLAFLDPSGFGNLRGF